MAGGAVLVGIGLGGAAPALRPWSRPTDPETLIIVAAWWTAVLLVAWLALSVVLWVGRIRRPGRRRRPLRLTAPGSRRVAEALLLVVTAACSPPGEGAEPPRIEILGPAAAPAAPPALPSESSTTSSGAVGPTTSSGPVAAASGSEPSVPIPYDGPYRSPLLHWLTGTQNDQDESAAPAAAASRTHVVERGEHFWSIARTTVATARGRPPSEAEIADYWVGLIRVNGDRIRSGDPDLIHPGEVLVLPPVKPAGGEP